MYGERPYPGDHPRGFLWALQITALPVWVWRVLRPGVPRMFRCKFYTMEYRQHMLSWYLPRLRIQPHTIVHTQLNSEEKP